MARRSAYIFSEEPHRGRGFLIGFLLVLLLAVTALVVSNFALNNTVIYTKEYITVPQLPDNLEGWTIMHLTDLNGEDLGKHQSAVRTAIGSRSYSCVVLGGNMVGDKGDVQPVLDLIRLFPQGTPILLLPGDSDPPVYQVTASSSLNVYAPWVVTLMEAGVTILDEPVRFQRKDDVIWFVPENLYTLNIQSARKAYQDQLDTLNAQVEDLTADQDALKRYVTFQLERLDRVAELVAGMQPDDIQVAVTHMPLSSTALKQAKNQASSAVFDLGRVSLVLAGGYCGGQWRIPGKGAVYVPELGFFPDDEDIVGRSYLGGVWQYISPGLGASSEYPFMPFRLFNSPGAAMLVLTTDVH